jgi:hypothetical protein
MSSAATRPLISLTVAEVQILLTWLNMSRFKECFLDNEIDGETLDAIEKVKELEDLGMSIPAKAALLFKKITGFKETGVPPSLLTPSALVIEVDHGSNPTTPKSATGFMSMSIVPQMLEATCLAENLLAEGPRANAPVVPPSALPTQFNLLPAFSSSGQEGRRSPSEVSSVCRHILLCSHV